MLSELELSSQAIIAEQLSAAPAQKCYDPRLYRLGSAIPPSGARYRPRRFPTRPRATRGPKRCTCSAGHMSRMDPDGASGAAAFHPAPLAPSRDAVRTKSRVARGRFWSDATRAIQPAHAKFCCGRRDAQRLDDGYAKCDDEGRLALSRYSNNGYWKEGTVQRTSHGLAGRFRITVMVTMGHAAANRTKPGGRSGGGPGGRLGGAKREREN